MILDPTVLLFLTPCMIAILQMSVRILLVNRRRSIMINFKEIEKPKG